MSEEEIIYSNIQTKDCGGLNCNWDWAMSWTENTPGSWQVATNDCTAGCNCTQPASDGIIMGETQQTPCV